MNKRIPPIEKVRLRTLTAVDGMSGGAGGNARAESNSPPASQTDAALGHNGDDGLPFRHYINKNNKLHKSYHKTYHKNEKLG